MTKDEARTLIEMLNSPDRDIQFIAYEIYIDWSINERGKGVMVQVTSFTTWLATKNLQIEFFPDELYDSR